MLVDDSALVRKTLSDVLSSDPQIEIIATAQDPFVAAQKLRKATPDVMFLDVEMPRMDGITFLQKLMSQHPIPVVMCSSLTEQGCETTLRALEYGAVDIIQKPRLGTKQFLEESRVRICDAVKAAAQARVKRTSPGRARIRPKLTADAVLPKARSTSRAMAETTEKVVVVGASTGGTEAIKSVLAALPADSPATLVVQHIPAAFSARFAEHVNEVTAMTVCEARDGQPVRRGHVYIAPGDRHLRLVRTDESCYCALSDDAPVNRHKPSVDVLFRSVSECAGYNAIGVILTGMGNDGARGLKNMQNAGALTIAQDEDSSLIWGMPGAAVDLKAADLVMPLSEISNVLINHKTPLTALAADDNNSRKRGTRT